MDRNSAKERRARIAFQSSCAAVALIAASGFALPAHAQRAGMIVENIPHMRPGMIVENIPHAAPPTMIVENIPHAPPATMIAENIPHARDGLIAINQPQAVAPPVSGTQAFQASVTANSAPFSLSQTAARDTVTVTSAETILTWAPLDTANSDDAINILDVFDTVTFVGPNADFTVLNRIIPTGTNTAGDLRSIAFGGSVESRVGSNTGAIGGNLWFYSPGGIIITGTGGFDVGGLVLTTNDIDTAGGLFGPDGEIRFRGAADSTASVEIERGANINAQIDGASYVAMVAPRIVQDAIVDVDGSVAYVAAEQADLTINSGLFDITVTVGTTDPNGIVHTGLTTGPAETPTPPGPGGIPAGVPDAQAIYFTAVAKNDALTMLLGGISGYTAAVGATETDGEIILSGGYDVSVGPNAADPTIDFAATPVNNVAVNADLTGDFRSDITGMVSGAIDVVAAPKTTMDFDGDINLTAGTQIDFGGLNGGSIRADADVTLRAGSGAQGGIINIVHDADPFDSDSLDIFRILGDLSLDVSARGVVDLTPGADGEDATAGTISINIFDGGELDIGGTASFIADAVAGQGPASTGDATAGSVSITLGGADGLGNPSTINVGTLQLSASADAASLQVGAIPTTAGGDAVAGTVSLNLQGGTLTAGNVLLDASARASIGNGAAPDSNDATAGSVDLQVTGGTHSIGSLVIDVSADDAASKDANGNDINGLANGGSATILVDAATVTLTNDLDINASTNGQTGPAARSSVDLTVQNGGVLDVADDIDISVRASGGNTGTLNQAGSISILADNATITTNDLFLSASSLLGAFGGSSPADAAAGGDISVVATNGGSITVNGFATANTSATSASASGGATGDGGTVLFDADDSTIEIFGSMFVDANGVGNSNSDPSAAQRGRGTGGDVTFRVQGAGGVMNLANVFANANGSVEFDVEGGGIEPVGEGGNGFGGQVTFDLLGGTFSANTLNVGADGSGGPGGSAPQAVPDLATVSFAGIDRSGLLSGNIVSPFALPTDPGARGGDGVGGNVEFNLDLGAGTATVTNFTVSANGLGGDGAIGDADVGLGAGDGGDGFGGTTTFNAISGTLNVTNTLTVEATGNSQFFVAQGGDGFGADGGNGGNGIGGSATFNLDGAATVTTNDLIVDTTGYGGAGGDTFLTFGTNLPGGPGGDGGSGTGGNAEFNNVAGTLTFSTLTVIAEGLGGQGGTNSGITVGDARDIGGNGGDAFGGTATINLNQDDATSPAYTIDASATGGQGGGGTDSGNGGNATGGNASLNINDSIVSLAAPSLIATARGGNAGFVDAPGGNGGNGGSAVGGTASLIVTGPTALLTLTSPVSLAPQVGGTGGNGADGGDAFLDAQDGGNGGDGGNGTGGTAEIMALSGATIDATVPFLTIFNTGAGGNGGDGGSNFATSGTGNGGNGGAAGDGTGGISRLTVDGGLISTNIVQLSSDGRGGNEGLGGTSGGALPGLAGIGGDGTGGSVEVSAIAGGTLTIASGVASIGSVLTLGASGTGTSAPDQSGDGIGGSVSVLADGGFIDILGTAVNGDVIRANGIGGSGATNVGSGFGGQIDIQLINGGSLFQSPAVNTALLNRLQLLVDSNGGDATADIGGLADGSAASISLTSSGGSLTVDNVLFRIDAFAGDGGAGFAGGNAFGGNTFTLIENSTAGDPSLFNTVVFQILNRAFGGVGGASADGGDGFGGGVTMTVAGDSVVTGLGDSASFPQFSVFGIGGAGGDTIDPTMAAGSGGDGFGGTMDIFIRGGTIDVQGFTMNSRGQGGNGGDYIDAVASGLAGQAGNGGDGTAGRVTIDMTGGTLSSNAIFNTVTGFGGNGGDADVGIAGNGGAGTGGLSEFNFASPGNSVITTGAVGEIRVRAQGEGGRAGQSANGSGGDAGDAFGGTAIATIDNGATVESLIFIVNSTGRAFAGGTNTLAAGGPGGTGGTGTGGSATLNLVDGALIAGDMIITAAGQGGIGGDSVDGLGGTGGAGIGGDSNIFVGSGSNLSMSIFKRFGSITNGANSEGIAGAGGTGAQGGGDGGTGTGGTATVIAQGGTISTFTGFSYSGFGVFASGVGGDAGGDPVATGGGGTGGLAILEVQEGSPGIIDVGNTQLEASGIAGSGTTAAGTTAGRVQLSDTSIDPLGLMNFTRLTVEALGTSFSPTSGFFMTGNSGATTVTGDVTIDVSGNAEFAYDGTGQLTVGGNMTVTSGADILVSHTNNNIPTISIDVIGEFAATADSDFDSMAGSIVQGGDSVDVLARSGNIFAADLRSQLDIGLAARQNVVLNDAAVTGPPVLIVSGTDVFVNNGIGVNAGLDPVTGNFDPNFNATFTGDITSTGGFRALVGGSIIFQTGTNVVSDNIFAAIAGDDLIVQSGASITAGNNPATALDPLDPFSNVNNLFLAAGGPSPILISPSPTPISSIVLRGDVNANGFAVAMIADAIDGLGGNISANSISANIFNAPANGVTQSDDNGLLSAGCVEGNVCLGTISANNIVQIGQDITNLFGPHGDVIQATIEGGTVVADTILVTTRRDLIVGTSGIASDFDAATELLLESLEGDINLQDASLSSDLVQLSAASGSLLGTGSITSGNDVGITVGFDIFASLIDAGGELTTVADIGGALEGFYSVPGSMDVGDLIIGAGDVNYDAGGDLLFGSITVPGSDIFLFAPQTVAIGFTGTAQNVGIDAGEILLGFVGAGGDINLLSAGLIDAGTLDAGNSITADAFGDIFFFDAISGGDIFMTAGGGIFGGNLSGSGLFLDGATIEIGDAFGDVIDFTSALDILFDSITSPSAVTLTAANGTIGANTGNGDIDSGGDVTLLAQDIALGDVTSGGSVDAEATTGDASFGTVDAVNDITIVAALNPSLLNAISGGNTSVTGAAITFQNGTIGGDLTLNALTGSIDGNGTITVGGGVDLDAVDSIAFGSLDAQGGDFTADAGGDIAFTAASAAGALTFIAANGSITGTDLAAGTSLTAEGATGFEVDTVTAGGDTALRSATGAVIVNTDIAVTGNLIASGAAILLNALGDLSVSDTRATNGDIDIIAGGNVAVASAQSVGDISLTSTGGSVTTGGIEVGLASVAPTSSPAPVGVTPFGRTVGSPGPGDITITAATDAIITADALATNNLFISAGGLIDLQALATGITVETSSADFDISRSGQLGTSDLTQSILIQSNGTNAMVLGGAGTAGAFSLDATEFLQIHSGGDLTIFALFTTTGSPTLTIEDLDAQVATGVGGTQDGNIGMGGAFNILTEGDIRVNGALALNGATANNLLNLSADTDIRLDAAAGNIAVIDANGGLAGQLSLSATTITAATDSAANDIAGATVADADARLANNDGIVRDNGFFQADMLTFTVDNGLYVQNSAAGTDFDDRRGFLVGNGGVTINAVSAGSAPAIVINGIQQQGGTTITGIDMITQSTINTAFAAGSTINGCLIANPASCTGAPPPTPPPPTPPPPTPPNIPDLPDDPIQDLVEEEIEEQERGPGIPISPLIETVDITPNPEGPIIDDPVTGSGNEDLWIRNPSAGGSDD